MSLHLAAGALCGVLGLGAGALVPTLIGRIPEIEPDPPAPEPPADADPADPAGHPPAEHTPAEPDVPFAEVAARPGLTVGAAVATGVCAAVVGLGRGWEWPLLFLVPLVPVGVALAVVDWHTRILPTWLIKPTYVATVALVLLAWVADGLRSGFDSSDLVRAALGWLIAGGLYFVLWVVYPRGMGYGDVRLSGILGIALGFLGWHELLVGIYGGFLLGGVLGGLLSAFRRVDRKGYPFGPFMLLGALVGVVFGQPIMAALVA